MDTIDIEVVAETESKFKMLASGRAFRLLSDTLYSDKPLAMARETINNALDAHRAIGTAARPFHVHLPSKDEPFFAVRDFGPSIRDENISDVYCTYFNSTKAADGVVFAGRLGLGTKAPFAVAESFTVTTYLDGTKRVYTIFYDADNEPARSPAIVSPTSEANGLEVHVKIEPGDFDKVIEATRKVLAFFDPMPIIANAPDTFVIPTPPDYDLTGEGFAIRAKTVDGSYYSSYRRASFEGKPRAIMGNMVYPIDTALVELSDDLTQVLNLPIDIFFPLGALDFQPSREALSYDKVMTLPGIRKALKSIKRQLKVAMNAKFAGCRTEGTARRLYSELCSGGKMYADIVAITKGVEWHNPATTETLTIESGDFPLPKGLILRRYEPGRREGTVSAAYVKSLPATKGTTLYRDDRPRPSEKLVAKEARNAYAYRASGPHIYLLMGGEAEKDAFLATLDNVTVELTSDLIDDTPKDRRVMPRRFANFERPALDRDGTVDSWVDMERGGYYVVTSHSELVGGLSYTREQFENGFTAAAAAGLFDRHADQYAIVPVSLSKVFIKHPAWKEFYPTMKAKAIRLLQRKDPFLAFVQRAAVGDMTFGYMTRRRLQGVAEGLRVGHPLRVFSETVQAWENGYTEQVAAMSRLVHVFGLSRPAPSLDYDLPSSWAALNARYPMLRYLYARERERYSSEVDDEDVGFKDAVAYVGLVDAAPVDNVIAMKPKATRMKSRAA